MSGAPIQPSAMLSPLMAAREPAFVREGSSATKHAYEEGVGFEEMLTEELSKSLTETAAPGGEGEAEAGGSEEAESSFGAGSSLVSSMLPRALSEGLVAGGGIGLAGQLAREIAPTQAGSTPTQAGSSLTAPTQAAPSQAATTQATSSGGARS